MTKYTTPHSLPWPEKSDKIASTASPEESIREDIQSLAVAANAALIGVQAEAAHGDKELAIEATEAWFRSGTAPADTRLVDSPYAIPFGDAAGYLAGGFTVTGQLELVKPITLPLRSLGIEVLDPKSGVGPLDPNTGFVEAYIDPDGYVAWGRYLDGTEYTPKASSGGLATKFLAAGDSMVRGGTVALDGSSHETWPLEDAWPAKLQAAMLGSTVHNQGYGGRTIDDVRWHIGDTTIWVEFPGGVLPATKGEYPVTVQQSVGTTAGTIGSFYGWAEGAGWRTNGNLKIQLDGTWIFDKYNDTAELPASGKVPFRRGDTARFDGMLTIFQMARNDMSFQIKGFSETTVEHIVASTVAAVEERKRQGAQVLILTICNRVQELAGSARYEEIIEANKRIAALYPRDVVDFRKWLVHEAIYAAGYTPTAADLANMEDDAPPPQIMDQGTHYLKPIAPHIAQWVKARLTERAYA